MLTVFSVEHALQHGAGELFANKFVPVYECPARAEAVLDRILARNIGPVLQPDDFGLEPILRVHGKAYVEFLQSAWADWIAAGGQGDALCCFTPKPDMPARVPDSIFARLGYYFFDGSAPITGGTWRAAYTSAQTALTAARLLVSGERAAFALCRPPGHHAAKDYGGGYCFLNNAAIAAQYLIDHSASRVAILDVDYHHGNGTQCIFDARSDVFFSSIHGDPVSQYPFYTGHADEIGRGDGTGHTLNIPLPPGTNADTWFPALELALHAIEDHNPDVVVISLGVDTYEGEPTSFFKLEHSDFLRLGKRLAGLGRPMLFVMEGGYNLEAIGINITNVLSAFDEGVSSKSA